MAGYWRPPCYPWVVPLPAADVEIDASRAAALVGDAFPALAGAPVRPFGSGYDNAAFLVDETWVFRFPRRRAAVFFLERELAALPRLSLPVAIPAPRHVSRPRLGFPFPFAGYRVLPGRPAGVVPEAAQPALAAQLGEALRALHAAHLDVDGTPAPDLDKTDRPRALRRLRLRLRRMEREGRLGGSSGAEIFELASALAAAEDASDACWVHGDLYPKHLLLDEAQRLSGIIDWGDLRRGDRAIDLAIAYGLFAPPARARFFEALGGVDEATHRRARFFAVWYGVVLSDFGVSEGMDDLVEIGQAYLARRLAEERSR